MNSANTNPRLPDAADDLPMDTMPLVVLKQFQVIYGSVRQHFRDVEQRCGVSGSLVADPRDCANARLGGV